VWRMLHKVVWYAVSVYLVFTVTISLFPAVISQVVSSAPNPSHSSWTGVYYSTLVCFLMFNVADLTGRYITHWVQVGLLRSVWSPWLPRFSGEQVGNGQRSLLLMTALRSLFIPAFLFCNVQVEL
jgi:equilibrative nucleoside transporter 1/2/3